MKGHSVRHGKILLAIIINIRMLDKFSLEKNMPICFRIVFTKYCGLSLHIRPYIWHFSQCHSERHAKKVWSFRGKISTFFPWNFSFSVTGKKIKRLFLAYNWKIIPVAPYSCLLCNLKKNLSFWEANTRKFYY